MNLTYEEIYEEMKTAFFEQCGKNAENLSDLGARFKAVASELFSVSCYGDYIFRQAFPQTASGDYLELHASQRGITRKTAEKAAGSLTFSLSETSEEETAVPAGTICSVPDNPYIQFITTTEGGIPAGSLSVTVPAEALEAGGSYNVLPGTVTVMVNPPLSVLSVTNEEAFQGGYSEESDEMLRERILSSYSVPQNGISAVSLAEVIKQLEYVTDCCVERTDQANAIGVYVKVKSGSLTDEQKSEIQDILGIAQLLGTAVTVEEAVPKTFHLAVEVTLYSGYDTDSVSAEILKTVQAFCSAEKIGADLSLSRLSAALYGTDGVLDFSVSSTLSVNEVIHCSAGEYLTLNELTVTCNE